MTIQDRLLARIMDHWQEPDALTQNIRGRPGRAISAQGADRLWRKPPLLIRTDSPTDQHPPHFRPGRTVFATPRPLLTQFLGPEFMSDEPVKRTAEYTGLKSPHQLSSSDRSPSNEGRQRRVTTRRTGPTLKGATCRDAWGWPECHSDCRLAYNSTMTALALALVLLSALCHAAWNLLLKRSGNQEVFVWALLVGGSVMLVPHWVLYCSGSILCHPRATGLF